MMHESKVNVLAKPHNSLALAHAALAPQVEFELLEGVQQQNTSGQDIR